MRQKKKHFWRRCALSVICVVLVTGIGILGLNGYVKQSGKKQILTVQEAQELADVDCILVLGCAVWSGGRPSYMLEDRLLVGTQLYENGVSGKLLMSGDHGRKDYDEVNTMKDFAMEQGVPSEDIFMDHAGFSTYESMYRAKEIFQADKIVIVTQEYHMYRALYVAKQLGMEAYGVTSDPRTYQNQTYRELREILARVKDVFTVFFRVEPSVLGEPIPIDGDGNITNDRVS